MQQVLAGVIAALIDVGWGVHASPKAHDQSRAPSLCQRSIRLAAIKRLRSAEDAAIHSDQVSEIRVHGRNYLARSSPREPFTRICG
jgi:hypothetical protein